MSVLRSACVSLLLLSSGATASLYPSYIRRHYPKAVQPLLIREEALDEKCRGGVGDDPATDAACKERDVDVDLLQRKGWCWGSRNRTAAEYQMTWLRCSDDRTR